eukprot:TRINITY_DN11152_c0_g1_i1.p1 TRINITY_DN11152_c0_g1~~TRINITY_DN11152_c0_g1_i1.p1  ORF type:complete len:215 (+),score=36.26 TRINITY_DN11152_c0_g1_i1:102-746(+)
MAEPENNDLVFKFIIVGTVGVGKSCLMLQFTEQLFQDDYDLTVGVEFGTYVTNIEDHQVKIQIWDTAGQESYRSITKNYYRGAHGILLVYDIANRSSFNYMNLWLAEVNEHTDEQRVVMMIGNKCDLIEERVVSTHEGEEFAKKNNILFMETSAKTALNVKEAFMKLSQIIYNEWKKGAISFASEEDKEVARIDKEKKKISHVSTRGEEKKCPC